MKNLIILLTLLISLTTSARRVTLNKNNDKGWYFVAGSSLKHNLQPGDTVVMDGDYSYINLDRVIGTETAPIVFIVNGTVRTGVNGSYGWIITNSKHFKVIGTSTNPADIYGLKIGGLPGQFIAQSFTFPTSDSFEIYHVEIANAQVGFFANPKVGNYGKIYIHDNYVHGLDNPLESGRSEGVYLGNTGLSTTTTGGKFTGVEISYNRFENLAGDGIQVALTENVYIHHNTIKGYGGANLIQQRSAIIIGGCTNGRVELNAISDGTGSPIQVFGGGDVFISGNTMARVATSLAEDGFYIDGKCKDGLLRVTLLNNTIDKVNRDIVRDVTKSVVLMSGNSWQPVPVPAPTVKKLIATIKVYDDGSVEKL